VSLHKKTSSNTTPLVKVTNFIDYSQLLEISSVKTKQKTAVHTGSLFTA